MIKNIIMGARKKDGINIAPETYITFINKNENMSIVPVVTASNTSIYYSADNGFGESDGNWMSWDGTSTIDIGKIVHMKGTSVSKSLFSMESSDNKWTFNNASDLEVTGDLRYLLCDEITDTIPTTYLGNYAFSFIFYNCTSLTVAPELPATTLADSCYGSMFRGCTSLVTAPVLPATTLAGYCYVGMLSGCTDLTIPPVLPATTLATNCYNGMFRDCIGLTTAPALPATTLAFGCYNGMFQRCTSLTTLPELPSTTLIDFCYFFMFYNCTKIKLSTTKTGNYQTAYRVPTSGTGTTNATALYNMFNNTGGTFKGTPTINTTYYTENQVI